MRRRISILSLLRRVGSTYSHCNSIRKTHYSNDYRGNFPRKANRGALVTFRPEKVKEECSSEDGSNSNSNKNIIRSDSDEIIVIFGGQVVLLLDKRLLVDVVCYMRRILAWMFGLRNMEKSNLTRLLCLLIQSIHTGSWRADIQSS